MNSVNGSQEDFRAPFPEPTNLMEVLRRRAHEQPSKQVFTFLTDGETEEIRLTYGELNNQAQVIGARLQKIGATKERAILLYPPGLDYIAGFWGCLYAGVTAVPAYPPDPTRLNRTLPRLQKIVADSQATFVLTTSPILAMAQLLFEQASDLQALNWIATDEVLGDGDGEWNEPDIQLDSLAFLQYTSGSTGVPKGVMLSHANLLHNSAWIAKAFSINPNDIGMIWLPPYHDMGLIGGIIQPIYTGVHCVLMSPISFLQRPYRWLQAISRYGATLSGGPNFAYDLCVRKITPNQREMLDLSQWRIAFNGAEPIRQESLKRFTQTFASSGFKSENFYPCYGLAEGTLLVSGDFKENRPVVINGEKAALAKDQFMVAEGGKDPMEVQAFIGCGQTLGDQEIVIAHPLSLAELGEDHIGEIWVSGKSVAHGYWRRPEDTKRTFQAYLSNTRDGPYLRTGDLGFLHEGELYITGRLKDLIIIRGRNFYPQDFELTVEQSHPALRPGCSAAFSVDVNDEERLIVIQELDTRKPFKADEVIDKIRQTLVQTHEVQPHGIVLIKPRTIPKTSSGKIQRHACRKQYLAGTLDIIKASEYKKGTQAPLKSISFSESLLVKALKAMSPHDRQSLLEVHLIKQLAGAVQIPPEQLAADLSLLSLGLDSASAAELTYEIETSLGVSLRMESLLKDITIRELAVHLSIELTSPGKIEARLPINTTEPPLTLKPEEHTLSHGQRALWFLHQLEPNNPAYNIVHAVRIRDEVDIPSLKNAFQTLVNRHPMLRTTISEIQGEPIQLIHPQMDVYFQVKDATEWNEAKINQRLTEEVYRPFDLNHGSLMRVILFSQSPRNHILLLAMNHIITDLWSVAIIMYEIGALYKVEEEKGKPLLKPLRSRYTDFVRAQNEMLAGPEGERLRTFWNKQLTGELPVLNLPTDRSRPPEANHHGACESIRLGAQLTQKLKTLAKNNEATPFMTLLAAFQVLLHRYTGQDDILVGSPKASRTRKDARLIGYFVNPVVIRGNLTGNPSFEEFLERIRQTSLAAFEHGDYPFPLLVEQLQPIRDPDQSPLFRVMFTWQKTTKLVNSNNLASFALGEEGMNMALGNLPIESMALEQWVSPFDLTLLMAEAGAELIATYEYDTDLFDRTTIQRMLGHFQTLLEGIATNPHQRLSDLPILTESEQHHILVDWNHLTRQMVSPLIHQIIEQQANLTPDAIAISLDEEWLTYAQLNRRANQLAHFLQLNGVKLDQPVGILAERSSNVIMGLLAILKAGGVYLPLDPSYPQERLAFMLEDADVKIVLAQTSLRENLRSLQVSTICLDEDWLDISKEPIANPSVPINPENIAYIIYTSGSTGQPKGVLISHGAIADHCHSIRDHFELTAADRVLQFASFSFDQSIEQILATLTAGAHLVLRGPDIWPPGQFPQLMVEKALTVINLPPAYWDQVVHEWATAKEPTIADQLRLVIIGGDVINPKTLALWHQLPVSSVRLLNAYGPTETTITAATFEIPATAEALDYQRIPIGRPVGNRTAVILDKYGNLTPLGVPGDLHIGGACQASGYLNQPELTKERFITHSLMDSGDEREIAPKLYKTGDLCRLLPDGNIEFLGRVDHQVKVRGFRVELGEIEATLNKHPEIKQTAVIALDTEQQIGDRKLVAYMAPIDPGKKPTTGKLKRFLKKQLPEYMVPSQFIILDTLPMSLSGKINRRALPAPSMLRPELTSSFVAPRNPLEQDIANMWAELLGMERISDQSPIGIYDNFFELGGHSLMATQLASRLRDSFRVEVPLRELYSAPTIANLSALILENQVMRVNDSKLEDLLQELDELSDEEVQKILLK